MVISLLLLLITSSAIGTNIGNQYGNNATQSPDLSVLWPNILTYQELEKDHNISTQQQNLPQFSATRRIIWPAKNKPDPQRMTRKKRPFNHPAHFTRIPNEKAMKKNVTIQFPAGLLRLRKIRKIKKIAAYKRRKNCFCIHRRA